MTDFVNKKSFLILLSLQIVILFLFLNPTVLQSFSKIDLIRPMVMGLTQLVQSNSDQASFVRSFDATNSSNVSTSATQQSRVIAPGVGFNQTIDEAQELTKFNDTKLEGPKSLFEFENNPIKLNITQEVMQPAIKSKNDGKSVKSTPKPILPTKEVLPTSSDKCDPINKIIFIKTHKTGSTTTASIFERYGYRRNLVFALPKNAHIFPTTYFSNRSVIPIPLILAKTHPHYDILDNHAVYNRKEMDKVIPNATYITILRDPVKQLESAFGYFEMYKGMGLSKEKHPFMKFMQNPFYYYSHKQYTMKLRSRNGQLIDLGLAGKQVNDTNAIKKKIETLDREIDFVLITEYFDESLLLMKKHLCWSFDDILYISNGIRSKSHRFSLSDELKDKIRRWNAGDVLLYNHFNRTLWQKIQDYGPNFKSDLEHFRKLEKDAVDRCIDSHRTDTKDRREEKFMINPQHSGKYCQDLLRADVEYTALLKRKMRVTKKLPVKSSSRRLPARPSTRRKRPKLSIQRPIHLDVKLNKSVS